MKATCPKCYSLSWYANNLSLSYIIDNPPIQKKYKYDVCMFVGIGGLK